MNSLDLALFTHLSAGSNPTPLMLQAALAISPVATGLIAVVIVWAAIRIRPARTDVLLLIILAGVVGEAAHLIAGWLNTPRPFMLGLSPNFAMHSGRGGMPSAHASVMFAVATFMLWRPLLRHAGMLIGVFAVLTGFARIYLGVHFPMDVLGGLGLGVAAGTLASALAARRDPKAAPVAGGHS
ncbi:phosphatase PAP2 family protein [Variovorax sp. RT4R15]|uniref:phosphatase PAP2 family protein n=1 Tax=Variovorax sp. RT4R15 TaxID=3443737 RepID=UPI003F47E0D9